MRKAEPYDKGTRKAQYTGSYGDFNPVHVKSEGERYPTDVVYFKTAEAEGEVSHPTQKPVELGRYLIRTYTNEGDVILDNCFGSGSFVVAAALENRNCIGIELNSEITKFKNKHIDLVDIAKKRLENITQVEVSRSKDWNRVQEKMVHFWEDTPFEKQGITARLNGKFHYLKKPQLLGQINPDALTPA